MSCRFKASMSSITDDCSQGKGVSEEEEEEDDELFEIDLDVVNSIPAPQYWEGYLTKTGSVLLANCLLPLTVVSSAVPADSLRNKGVKEVSRVVMMIEVEQTKFWDSFPLRL